MRYSDKRLNADFTIHVLLSDRLETTVAELVREAEDTYPGLDWSFESQGQGKIDTRDVTVAVDLARPGEARGLTRISGYPGRCELNWDHVFDMSRVIYPNARDAVGYHTDFLSITVSPPKGDTTLAARFDAARRMTCLGALLARLPMALGVYFSSADLLVPPRLWVEAAETALKGEVPVLQWIAIYANQSDCTIEENPPVTTGTVGMAAFNGHEIVMPQARIPAQASAEWIFMTVRMLLESDHQFRDSDTLGVEGEGCLIRIRHLKEGQHEMQTDAWLLFHPSTVMDEESLCGPRSRINPPPGMDTRYSGDWESLKNKLYSFVASGRA
jgi:hypothetical protein